MIYPKIKTASAGSGKTYSLTEIVYSMIVSGEVKPEHIIATTFTVKAANEIKSRVREKLIKEGRIKEANRINAALIGTLNSIALKLVQRFAIESGISPTVETLGEEEQAVIIREIIGTMVTSEFLNLSHRLNQVESFFSKKLQWLSHIESIIASAKVNNISADNFQAMGEDAIAELWSIIPESGTVDMAQLIIDLRGNIQSLLDSLHYAELKDNNKAKYQSLSEIDKLLASGDFKYNDFAILQKLKLPKYLKVELLNEDIMRLSGRVTQSNQFKEDMELYIRSSFLIASLVIKEYDDIKRQKGLLDFADQEAMLHKLLSESDHVQCIFKEEYKLIIWDEFQDSSPLQASIFIKLTQLIEHSYCLLDNKQSIYSFRNASPELIKGIVDLVPAEQKSQLPDSYRSTAHLVNFSNSIFSDVFDDMPESEVVLNTADANITNRDTKLESKQTDRINVWRFERGDPKPNILHYNIALVNRIISFVEAGHEVFDKEAQHYRPVSYGDIMILVKANSTIAALSELLLKAHIPVASTGIGLCNEPEIVYIMALLKLLVYPDDTLAKAEVLLYTIYNGSQKKMIEDRLKYDKVWEWQQENPVWESIKNIKAKTYTLSLTKTLKLIFEQLDMAIVFAAWGNISQRLANFEALLKHTQDYQDKCKNLNQGSSILGLLGFLRELTDTDADEKGRYLGSAVKIMTYHSSKGLESNVLILWDMHKEMKTRFYGVDSYSTQDITLDDLLADRKISFRINPFENKRKDIIGWSTYIDESEQMISAAAATLNEEKRLLYVGVTRARDYLIWGMTDLLNKTKEYTLETISPQLQFKDYDDGVNKDVYSYKGATIPVRFETRLVTKEEELDILTTDLTHNYYPRNTERKSYLPKTTKPSEAEQINGTVVKTIQIHNPLSIADTPISDAERGDFFHSLYAAIDPDMDRDKAIAKIIHIASLYDLGQKIDAEVILLSIVDFYNYIHEHYEIIALYRELSVQGINAQAQVTSGFVDFLIETKEELYLLDFKSFYTSTYDDELYNKKALSYKGQLEVYKSILQESFKKPVSEKIIYFCVMGRMVSVG